MTAEAADPGGDLDAQLAAAFDRHRRELHVHCYRMTGSLADAEDLTQETFLRAWRTRERFEERSSLRTWLYRIATNACLDHLRRHPERTTPIGTFADPLEHASWLDPYPDGEVDDVADAVARREATDLALVAALTGLPPRQRAAFVARDLLGFTAAETAALLDTTVASANSLVQRARALVRRQVGAEGATASAAGGAVASAAGGGAAAVDPHVRRYLDAHRRHDADAIVAMLHDDVRITMPPEAPCTGREAAAAFFRELLGAGRPGEWLLVETAANGRPAIANYLRRRGDAAFRAVSVDVLDLRDGVLVGIHCFLGDRSFPAFGLPLERTS